jgi:sporulation protein YlmC with PRC-barrel domain
MKAKTLLPTIALCLTGSLWAGSALSDGAALNQQSGQAMPANQGKSWILSQIKDATVKDVGGENLGQIKDILLNLDTGRATFAVLQLSGAVGRSGAYTPVPWALLKPSSTTQAGEPGTFILNTDKSRLASAQTFDHWPDYNQQNWAPQVYSYYGLDSSTLGSGTATTTSTGTSTSIGATGPNVYTGAGSSYNYQRDMTTYQQDMSRYGPTRADGTPIDNSTAPDGKGTFFKGIRR